MRLDLKTAAAIHGSAFSHLGERTRWVLALAIILVLAAVARPAQGQTLTVLYAFKGGADGASPAASVMRDAAGNLYGTTDSGGTSSNGTVFKVDSAGRETVLYSFTGGADGGFPAAGVIEDAAGNLYGTTINGGAFNNGTVFKLSSNGEETVLYSFTGGSDGGGPSAGVIRDAAGNLYGTTVNGGSSLFCAKGCGTVFKLDTTGKETVLYSFTGKADGAFPTGRLTRDAAFNMYSTTQNGGANNNGTVFKLDPRGKETVLYSFPGGAQVIPLGGVIRDAAGNLYGVTELGGAFGDGTVFKLDTTGKETVLHSFTAKADGAFPIGGVIQDAAGNLYGTTSSYGNVSCDPPFGCGTVFKIVP
jgi:uncharacterized repeat protein (TIGR03803 family)